MNIKCNYFFVVFSSRKSREKVPFFNHVFLLSYQNFYSCKAFSERTWLLIILINSFSNYLNFPNVETNVTLLIVNHLFRTFFSKTFELVINVFLMVVLMGFLLNFHTSFFFGFLMSFLMVVFKVLPLIVLLIIVPAVFLIVLLVDFSDYTH